MYDDPAGYDVAYSIGPGAGAALTDAGAVDAGADAESPDASATGRRPELLDKARRGANAINAGVRTALDPIKDLVKTQPTLGNDTVTYGPTDRGATTYRFTVHRLSALERRFGWALEGKPSGTNAGYLLVAGGSIRVGDTPRRGRGVLGADFDAQSSVDPSVHAKGKLLIGFAEDRTTTILRYVLDGFTPNSDRLTPLDATAIGWHRDDVANDARVALRTNLDETATSALETVVVKLRWRRGTGVRVDAVATGGDVDEGSRLVVSTCVPPSLDEASASTSTMVCKWNECTSVSGPDQIDCPQGLETPDIPTADPTADDPPMGIPEVPNAPEAVPNGM
jgi:hypothetical protein